MEVQLDLFSEEYISWDALWLQIGMQDETSRTDRYRRSVSLDALAGGRTFMLPAEMGSLHREVRSSFVNGEFLRRSPRAVVYRALAGPVRDVRSDDCNCPMLG